MTFCHKKHQLQMLSQMQPKECVKFVFNENETNCEHKAKVKVWVKFVQS